MATKIKETKIPLEH